MSDRMAAENEIGGPISRRVVPRLIKAIQDESVFVGWGEALFDASNAYELLGLARQNAPQGTLMLADPEASGGCFEALEAFLHQHRISFNRFSEAKYEFDGELVQYRHRMKAPLVRFATQTKTPVVPVPLLEPVRLALEQGHLKKALQRLRKALGPTIPPLEPLRIER